MFSTVKAFAIVCVITLAAVAGFAAASEGGGAAPDDDCGVASNCGGLGGWRVILLATGGDDAGGDAGGDVEDPVEPEEPTGNRARCGRSQPVPSWPRGST